MHKRILSLVLCLMLVLGMGMPVLAEGNTLRITNAEDLLAFAENCRLDTYSLGITVVLEADIDMTGVAFTPIPVFSGTFDGAGHKITGLTLQANGSDQGFFRYLTATAEVKELQLEAVVEPEGSRNQVGTLAGENAGRITGCTVTTQLTGSSRVGGVAGVNTVTGVIENCKVSGQLYGDHFVGGIAGENRGVIRSCGNSALINVTPKQNSVELSDITLDSLTNSEAVNTVTDIGGIAGISSGVLRDCENQGAVGYKHMGYNIGGIAGTQGGYLTGCTNTAPVQGRKEVGGIAGQMEPVIFLVYSKDVLQQLDDQLGGVSAAMDQATDNAMAGATAMDQQMSALQAQADAAREAVEVLTGGEETDPDKLLAAYNSLSNALTQMPQTMESLAATAKDTADGLSDDLKLVSGQVSAMGATIKSAQEYLDIAVEDVSDLDTPEDTTGKLSDCTNQGDVLADLNAGGIVGTVAMETDMDTLGDLQSSGGISADVQAQLRAVIRDCENSGAVTARKQYAGGIVGSQTLGLVRDCRNTGELDSQEYAGGIAGYSLGKLRFCYAKCRIRAGSRAGGIAGSGTVVTDCRTIICFDSLEEQTGAILGSRESENAEITGNYYLVVDRDPGAIDGISYDTQAQPMELADFAALEDLPESFSQVTVRFQFADGSVQERTVPLGGDLAADQVPALPDKSAYTKSWEGLTEEALKGLLFDVTFHAAYRAYSKTIASREEKPLILVEGAFTDQATVAVEHSDSKPVLKKRQSLVGSWELSLTEPGKTVHFLLPQGAEGNLTLLLRMENGQWQEQTFIVDGSYCVFDITGDVTGFALVETAFPYLWVIAGGVALLLTLTAATLVIIKKRKKTEV